MSIFSDFNSDWFEMIFRFFINLFFISLIVAILSKFRKNASNHIFSFILIGIIIFFLCFTLKKFDLNMGLALGLFAVFGIIRYRTEALKANEMTYIFVTIGVSLINALSNDLMSLIEILTINIIIVFAVFVCEKYFLADDTTSLLKSDKQRFSETDVKSKMNIILPYNESSSEKIEMHIVTLEKNLSIKVHHYQVTRVDYTTQMFQVNLYYTSET